LGAGVGNIVTIEGIPGTVEHVNFSAYQLDENTIELSGAAGFGLTLARISHQRAR